MAEKADKVNPLAGCSAAFIAALTVQPVAAVLLDDILAAATRGQCIEGITFRLIKEQGPANATTIVEAALEAYGRLERQQRALGCTGDIAAQAIAAGAEPDQVLQATAAGL